MAQAESSHPIILFDGVCNLCNHSVNFIIDRDKKNLFRFGALQSEEGKRLLSAHLSDVEKMDSVALLWKDRLYQRSDAALEIARLLGGVWKIMYVFKILPLLFRDTIYNWVAKNRYSWFGHQDACRIPTPELRAKFIHS